MHISSERKEINVVKVRFTMRYSSRKLSNDKVITTACNFGRQIACSFQVMSGNILFLGNKIFEIPPFFHPRPGNLGKKVHACSLRFSALKPGDRSVNRRGSFHVVQRKTPFHRPFPENLSLQNTDGEVARVDCEEDLFCNGWDVRTDDEDRCGCQCPCSKW